MADISQIKLPNNTVLDLKDAKKTGIYPVIGTQTAATGTWTGVLDLPALYAGLTIMYYLPWAGSGNATLNLTLSDGTTTGAKNCYYNTGRLTTHYGKGCNIVMTYWPAGSIKVDGTATTDDRWIANANYVDGNSAAYYITNYYNYFVAGSNKIFPYTIVMQNADGRWESLVTSSSTGTSKARNTHGFRLGQMAFLNANATYAENDQVGNNQISYLRTDLIDHRYSFNTANNATSGTTAKKPIYLVGAINASDGLFYLDTTWWTQTLPSTADGKLYIYLGDAYNYYRMSFVMNHPVYWYKNGAIRQFTQDSATVSGLTVQTAVPANAVFTDTKVTQSPNDSTANNFEVLFSTSADNTSKTEATQKSSKMTFNPSAGTLTTRGLEVKGVIAGDSGSTGHGLCGGGGYHNAYNNILLHGDASTGTSGIAFVSDKSNNGTITNVNQPSDRGFIQYHACGITTATAESTNPTLATTGENGRLVIGIGNDATDQLWLQTPGRTGLIHQNGASSYVIPDTGNTSGSVGSATQPTYVDGAVIKACTNTLSKSVPSDAVFTDTKVTASDNHYTPATVSGQDKTASATGATAAWSIDVVKGVTLNTDGKGHVTGLSVTSGKIPANPNTDTKVRQTLSTTNKNYPLLMSYAESSNTTGNIDNVSYRANTIYANPSTGNIQATQLNGVTIGSSPKFTDHTYSGTGLISVNASTGVISTTATANTGTITSVKTTAGAHTAINVTSGAANFNVPTKTSHLTNDSGFVTSDSIGVWTSASTAAVGDTSITISNSNITANSVIDVYTSNSSGTYISLNTLVASAGSATITFDALAESTQFKLFIR